METAPVTPASVTGKTGPRDFFLWAGAVIALYASVVAFITLLFEYIDRLFPDALAGYADPYGGAVRFSMATLIVLVPTALMLLRIIRMMIVDEPAKAHIWVRRWALMLTIFIAGAAIVTELISLINTFLGGEITTRFLLKVIVVLIVAFCFAFHFLWDLRGHWLENPKKANLIGVLTGLLTIAVIVAGFFIIGSPQEARMFRFDEQKVSDLQGLQYQVVNYWQQKQELPVTLDSLADSIGGYIAPLDPQTGAQYTYEVTGKTSFKLCAVFNQESADTKGQGAYPSMGGYRGDVAVSYPSMPTNENWQHGAGGTCFERTIDPELYPPYPKPL